MASVHFSVGSWYGVRHATDRKPRLQVMITTSHSAPYEATSDEARDGTGPNPAPTLTLNLSPNSNPNPNPSP